MLAANRFAFKEWAVVCEALLRGRQSLILRKGGIHEGRDGFHVEHREFWLFPTRFHQQPGEIVEEARPLIAEAAARQPANGEIQLQQYALVENVIHIEDEAVLTSLAGLHVWSDETVSQRFHYRRPGLFALVVRMYSKPEPVVIPESPHFAGCRSWVDLPEELPTAGLQPVLGEQEFAAQRERIRSAIAH